jgi:hypothetical protein
MSGFILFTKRNPCPVGGEGDKGCRQSKTTGMLFCRCPNPNPVGLNFIGMDRNDLFALYVEGEGNGKRPDRPVYTPTEPSEPDVPGLHPEQRDKGYQPITGKLELGHRVAIRKGRNISDKEQDALVSAGLLSTWPGGQTVAGAHVGLPGVKGNGRLAGWNTWGVFAKDLHGRIVGVQYRNDRYPDRGKYLWASGKDKGGAAPHIDGELPLTFLGTPKNGVAELAEGIGLKPGLGWLRYDGLWIGAAGGQFASSQKQLRAALEFHSITQVILNADGGAIANHGVMTQYRALANLLQDWGIPLKVRWWGQVTKDDGDVDEIAPEVYHGAKLLTWAEFEAMAPTDHTKAQRRQRARDTKALKRQQTKARALAILTQALPTAHRETRGGYLPPLPPLPEGFGGYALDAGMGAGKTTTIGRDIVEPTRDDGGFNAELFPRNSLGQQTTEKHGTIHVHDLDKDPDSQQAFGYLARDKGGVGLCVPSIPRVLPHIPSDPTVVIDEAMATFTEALEGGILKGRYSEVIEEFFDLIRSASTLTISESNLDAPTLALAERVSGKRLMMIRHHSTAATYPIRLAVGGSPNAMFGQMAAQLLQGQRVWFCTTSLDEAHAWELWAKDNGIKVKIITGETNESDKFRDFFSNPDKDLEDDQTQFLITTQSVQTGLSVERYHFDAIYGYGPGFAPEVIYQMVGRYRLPAPRYIWVPEFIQPSRYERPQKASILEEIGHEMGQWAGKGFAPKPDTDQTLIDEYLAARWEIRWAQKVIPGQALTLMFERAGQTVTPWELGKDEATKELRAEYREKLARIRSEFHAGLTIDPEVHTAEWAKAKRDDGEATYRDRCILRKLSTLEKFPGVDWDNAEIWYQAWFMPRQYEAGEQTHGPIAPGASLWAECGSADTLIAMADDEAANILAQRLRSISLLPDYGAKLAILAPMRPLCEQIVAKGATSPHCPLVKRLAAMARAVGDDLFRYLRIVAGDDHSDQAIANKILRKFGLLVQRDTYRKVGRTRQWSYTVTAPPLWQTLVDARQRSLDALAAKVSSPVTDSLKTPFNKSVTPNPPDMAKPTHRWPLMGLEGWIDRIEAGVNAIFRTVSGAIFTVWQGELEAIA